MSAQPHSIFISYRRVDSAYAVDQLDELLKRAFGADAVFRDASSIEAGAVFPERIHLALDAARVALVVIGPWWLWATTDPDDIQSKRRIDDPTDWVRIEIERLLQRGDDVSVIPVLLGGASIPSQDDLPRSMQALPIRQGMLLPPFPNFAECVRQLIEAVAKILNVTPQPVASVSNAVEEKPRFGGNGLMVTGKTFVGREQELHLLDEAWGRSQQQGKINILSLIGQGGEGKSALVLQWQARRVQHGWQGARRVFEWSFYSQGSSPQSSASADDFFNAAFTWFDKNTELPKDSATKGAKLAEIITAERTLLVLDGLESLQQPPGGFGGEIKDPAMRALLRGLARHNLGLCILTSRTNVTDLSPFEHAGGSCLRHVLHSLDPTAARNLLRDLGVLGSDSELDQAAEWFQRHAYDLNLLGNYLAKCTPDHDIRGWQQRFSILKEDERIHPKPDAVGKCVGHGRRMLRAYEEWLGRNSPALAILRLLGLFDRPVRSDLLDELRAAPVIPGLTEALVSLPDDDWLLALAQLDDLALISRKSLLLSGGREAVEKVSISTAEISDEMLDAVLRGLPVNRKNMPRAELKRVVAKAMADVENEWAKAAARPRRAVRYVLDTHPLLREHFAADLCEHHENARREGHQRLYAYLCATTPDKPNAAFEDLQPLYQAVAHGCQAGLQRDACDKVYVARIQRGQQGYSTRKLGALESNLGAIARFFEKPWSRVSPAFPEAGQAWLLSEAAFRLHGLGRLTEALKLTRASCEMWVKQKNWKQAAIQASNLSEQELTLGEVVGAVQDAELSVLFGDRAGDALERISDRTAHAHALHQAGRLVEAENRFREAEKMQARIFPPYPLLYSLQGFQYCDLLLTAAEREAGKVKGETKKDELLAVCRAVSERSMQTFKWADNALNGDILSIAISHLTLGRAALYAEILESCSRRCKSAQTAPLLPTSKETQRGLTFAATEIDSAVTGLRHAGVQHLLPNSLLTRAWLRSVTGLLTGGESAQSDLDEAWEIAKRGPMPLFMADVHLYRARIFFRAEKYPWVSPQHDLAEARRLIEKHGYLRRREELEDAEHAVKYLGNTPTP